MKASKQITELQITELHAGIHRANFCLSGNKYSALIIRNETNSHVCEVICYGKHRSKGRALRHDSSIREFIVQQLAA